MPLVRVTPENAVQTVHDQVEDFRETIAGAGRAPAFLNLAERAEDLVALISTGTLEAELLALDGLHPQWTGSLAHWLEVDAETLARTLGEDRPFPPEAGGGTSTGGVSLIGVRRELLAGGRRAGERVPPILIVASGSVEPLPEEAVESVVREMRRRPLTLLVGPEASDWGRALAGLGSREDWEAKFVALESLAEHTLRGSFRKPPWAQAGKMACAWSVTRALSSLETAFSVLLEKEGRALAAKKAALEARASHSGGVSNPNEVVGEVRSYLQKRFDGFAKETAAGMADLVAPHDGTLTQEIEGRIGAWSGFDYEKKPKVDVITIPKSVEEGLLERVREALTEQLRGQWTRMRELLRTSGERVEQILDDRDAPPVALHFQHLPEQKISTLIERNVGLNRPYRGELARRGPMDYFMAARRYQMLFFMIFSAFGLSFIRSFTYFTVPAGVVLLAFGMLNVVNAAKKQRAETEEKELGKAREALRADLARSMSDVQKAWDQAVANHLSAQQSQALETVEGTVKTVAAQAGREAAEQKELAQQQMKGIDGAQRKITDGVRKAEAAATDLENLSGQLIEFYGMIVGPPDAGGAAGKPGVPGLPGGVGKPAVPGSPGVPGVPGVPGAAKPAVPGRGGGAGAAGAAGGVKVPQVPARPGAGAAGAAGAAKGGGDALAELKAQAAEKLKAAKAAAGGSGAAGGKGAAGGRPGAGRAGGLAGLRSGGAGAAGGAAKPGGGLAGWAGSGNAGKAGGKLDLRAKAAEAMKGARKGAGAGANRTPGPGRPSDRASSAPDRASGASPSAAKPADAKPSPGDKEGMAAQIAKIKAEAEAKLKAAQSKAGGAKPDDSKPGASKPGASNPGDGPGKAQ